MAIILEHPDKDKNFSEETFDLGEGSITIRRADDEPLTFHQCIGMLETVKALLMDYWLRDDE